MTTATPGKDGLVFVQLLAKLLAKFWWKMLCGICLLIALPRTCSSNANCIPSWWYFWCLLEPGSTLKQMLQCQS